MTHTAIDALKRAAVTGPNATMLWVKPGLITDELRAWLLGHGAAISVRGPQTAITIPDSVAWEHMIDIDDPRVISYHPTRI